MSARDDGEGVVGGGREHLQGRIGSVSAREDGEGVVGGGREHLQGMIGSVSARDDGEGVVGDCTSAIRSALSTSLSEITLDVITSSAVSDAKWRSVSASRKG